MASDLYKTYLSHTNTSMNTHIHLHAHTHMHTLAHTLHTYTHAHTQFPRLITGWGKLSTFSRVCVVAFSSHASSPPLRFFTPHSARIWLDLLVSTPHSPLTCIFLWLYNLTDDYIIWLMTDDPEVFIFSYMSIITTANVPPKGHHSTLSPITRTWKSWFTWRYMCSPVLSSSSSSM